MQISFLCRYIFLFWFFLEPIYICSIFVSLFVFFFFRENNALVFNVISFFFGRGLPGLHFYCTSRYNILCLICVELSVSAFLFFLHLKLLIFLSPKSLSKGLCLSLSFYVSVNLTHTIVLLVFSEKGIFGGEGTGEI